MGRGLEKPPRWVVLLLLLLSLAAPRSAAADEPPSFRWSFVRLPGAESCPAAEKIAGGVRLRLGRDPFSNDADRNIEGSVAREEQRWRAHLSLIGPDGSVMGSRDLESTEPDCATLADAVTLAVALVIDPRAAFAAAPAALPSAAAAADPAPPSPPPTPSAPVSATPSAKSPLAASLRSTQPSASASASRVSTSLRGLVALGLLPRAALGVESAGEVGLSARLRLSTGLTYLPEVRTPDSGFAFGLSAAALGLCWGAVDLPRARLSVCAEGQLGAMHAVVYAVKPFPPGDHAWLGVRFGPRLQLRLVDPIWLEAGGMGLVPLLRHQFVLRDRPEPVFQSSPVTLVTTLGLSASIR